MRERSAWSPVKSYGLRKMALSKLQDGNGFLCAPSIKAHNPDRKGRKMILLARDVRATGSTFNPDMLTIACGIREMSMRDLSRACGIPVSTLFDYESGWRPIRDDHLQALADTLGFPAAFFYRGGKQYPPLGYIHQDETDTDSS